MAILQIPNNSLSVLRERCVLFLKLIVLREKRLILHFCGVRERSLP